MLGRLGRVTAAAVAVAALVATPALATTPPPEPTIPPGDPSLYPVPPGCVPPAPADVAFVGTVLAKDEFIEKGTVRYHIDQLRAGNATPYATRGLIDVRYGPDSQYLDVGEQYLVGASVDPTIGVLTSKVSPEAPLFGGDVVIGLDDSAVECPAFDDPVQTLTLDGDEVETGLLEPLFADRRLLLATIAVPAAIAGLVLVGLVVLRRVWEWSFRGVFALGRAAVTPSPDHVAARVRRHKPSGRRPKRTVMVDALKTKRGPA